MNIRQGNYIFLPKDYIINLHTRKNNPNYTLIEDSYFLIKRIYKNWLTLKNVDNATIKLPCFHIDLMTIITKSDNNMLTPIYIEKEYYNRELNLQIILKEK